MGVNCPKCHIAIMESENAEGTLLDRCPSCRGIFFNRGELEAMLRQKKGNTIDTLVFSPTSDEMDSLPAECPLCRKPMGAVSGPGSIRIDLCPACGGIFLDQGEFASLQLYCKD